MMRTLPRNVMPFTLDGWPVDALDQTTLMELRKLADQTGRTVADILHNLTKEFLAELKAEQEYQEKIVIFPQR